MTLQEFTEFYNKNRDWARTACYSVLGEWSAAQDVTHEVFLKIWTESEKRKLPLDRAYVYKMLRNLCINELRRRKRRNEQVLDEKVNISDVSQQKISEGAQYLQLIEVYFDKLTNQQQRAILLWTEGYSGKEAADRMGQSISYVRYLISTGLKEIRTLIQEAEEKGSKS